MIDSRAAFDCSKPHAIDIELQAVVFDLVAVSSAAVGFDELAATLFADVALLAILVTVLGAVARFASWTFHPYSMQRRTLELFLNLPLPFSSRRNFGTGAKCDTLVLL